MSGNNEANSTALISDFLSEKKFTQSRTIDSGVFSSENLSEDILVESSGCISCEKSTENNCYTKEIEIDEKMKVDSGVCCTEEDHSSLKLKNPFINDLSRDKEEARGVSGSNLAQSIDGHKLFLQDEDGDTYLHAAILHCQPEVALALIRSAPSSDYLDLANEEGTTPLHLAVLMDQWRIVRWLIIAGADAGLRNLGGESALHIAARLGSVNCCKAITDHVHCNEREAMNLSYKLTSYKLVNLDQWDYEGRTCIHVAAENGHVNILRLLIWHGANINAREGKGGYTVLHYAVERQNYALTHFLLTECDKLDTSIPNYAGRSVLQLGLPISNALMNILLSRGVASSYSSEEESMDDSEEEVLCGNVPTYMPQLVNGCA